MHPSAVLSRLIRHRPPPSLARLGSGRGAEQPLRGSSTPRRAYAAVATSRPAAPQPESTATKGRILSRGESIHPAAPALKEQDDNVGFITEERKKKGKPTVQNKCGIALTGPKYLLRPAIPTTQLYVSRVHHSVKAEEVVEYMRVKTNFTLRVEQLESRHKADGSPVYGYHMKVGVPKANALRRLEAARIVGGSQVADASIVPHQVGIVAILTTGWMSICGGALISGTRVLTAAHCWWDGQNQARLFTVVLGSVTIFSGGTRIETSDVTAHASWNTNDYTNDVAIVRISTVSFNNNIQAIPLPAMADVNRDFAGLTATVSGYGKTSDAQTSTPVTTSLYQTSVEIITNTVCQNSFSINIHGSHMCTSGSGGRGTCDGDSGGPLTVVWNNQRILIGIVSFGPTQGCEFGHPSVFTRVTAFLNWINSHM